MTENLDWLEDLRRDAEQARARQTAGGSRKWSLYGQNAIVAPGHELILRLLPHPRFKDSILVRDSKAVKNPQYVPGPPWAKTAEHWFDNAEGKRDHAWCLREQDPTASCPLCEYAEELMKSSEDEERKAGYQLRAKEAFLFTAILGPIGKRRCRDDGLIDIRILPVPPSVFIEIANYFTGGETSDFAHGDLTDPRDGTDLKIRRPTANAKGERWTVQIAPKSSPLYSPEEAAAFMPTKEWPPYWVQNLIDLRATIESEKSDYKALYKRLHGTDPEGWDNPEESGGEEAQAAEKSSAAKSVEVEDPFADLAGADDPRATDEEPFAGAEETAWEGFGVEPEAPPARPTPPSRKLPPPAARPGGKKKK